jgi:hypothetical protein
MKCEKCGSAECVTRFEVRIPAKNGKMAMSYWRCFCRVCTEAAIRKSNPQIADEILSFFAKFSWSGETPAEPSFKPI